MVHDSVNHHVDIGIGGDVSSSPIVVGNSNNVKYTIVNNYCGLISPSSDKVTQATQPLFYVPRLSGSSVFVERTEDIESVATILLNQSHFVAEREALSFPLVGLWGPPGYGKTTFAKMVCQQEAIKERFTGGIFFIEASEALDGGQEFRKLCEKVRDSYEGDIQVGTLLKLWNKQPTLIVLDNVETKAKLDSLLEISESDFITWLVTTQNKEIFVTHQNYKLIEVYPLTKLDIIAALKAPFLKAPFEDEIDLNDEQSRELADLLHHWPILLGIALEEIQRLKQESSNPKFIIKEVIENIKISGWMYLDHENRIVRSFQKTFEHLSQEDRENFQRLFIFSSNLDIPFSIIGHVCDLPLQSVKTLCSKLYKFALIKSINREKKVVQTSSFIRKYFLSDSHLKQKLIHTNRKFVEYYENMYGLSSPEDLPESIPLEELKFLNRVYKRHWLREKRRK